MKVLELYGETKTTVEPETVLVPLLIVLLPLSELELEALDDRPPFLLEDEERLRDLDLPPPFLSILLAAGGSRNRVTWPSGRRVCESGKQ